MERREQRESRRQLMATLLSDLFSAPVLLSAQDGLARLEAQLRLSNSMRLEFLHKRLASPTRLEDPNSDRGERPRLE